MIKAYRALGQDDRLDAYLDELEQIGLGVPQMTHLIHRLEKATGCRLGDAITLEEGLPLIEQWWHAKGTSR